MLSDFIKYSFIFLYSSLINFKFLRHNLPRKNDMLFITSFALLLSLLTVILNMFFAPFIYIIPLLLFWFTTNLYFNKPQITFVTTTISFVISYCLHAFSSFCALWILTPFYYSSTTFPYPVLAITTSVIHILLTFKFLRIKRFQKTTVFLSSNNGINTATITSLVLIAFLGIIPSQGDYRWIWRVTFIIFVFTLAFLIFWWQAQITKSYRHSLELRELESLRTEIVEKDILIQRLLKENDRLATITHRDNTLIATLANSACSYLMTDYANPAVAIEVRDSLIANIKKLSDGRLILPDDYNKKKARDFDTGFSLLDEMLHHMDEDAIEMDITFSVHLGVMPGDFVPRDISEMELVHLVDDLLKNAFKAARNSESRMVQLQFYKLGRHFVVEVSDNGIPFGIKSLVNMGIEKMTTYEDGSGIGLMDIWNTKEKHGATYHLEEYAAPSPFSKKISLTFDKKNRYSIRTWRKDEILQMSKRADLQVYGHGE